MEVLAVDSFRVNIDSERPMLFCADYYMQEVRSLKGKGGKLAYWKGGGCMNELILF